MTNEEGSEIKKYIFNKLIFPKIILIDNPGVLINKTSRIFKGNMKKRLVYEFEDIFSELQIELAKKIGFKKSSDLWYKIGKDFGTNYTILSGVKKVPTILFSEIVKAICFITSKNGTSVAKNVNFSNQNNTIIIEGTNNLVCRFYGDNCFFSGMYSGIISALIGKNIEAKGDCKNCPTKCKIILDSSFDKKYIPSSQKFNPMKDYEFLNFPEQISLNKVETHKDFIKFGKININQDGKYVLDSKILVTMDPSLSRFIFENFSEIGETEFLKNILVKTSEKIASDLIKGENVRRKISHFTNIFSALGKGIPVVKFEKKKVSCTLIFPPTDKNTLFYHSSIINGYLNYIFGRKLKFVCHETTFKPFTHIFYYE